MIIYGFLPTKARFISLAIAVCSIPVLPLPALADIVQLATKSGDTIVTIDTEHPVIRYTAKGAGQNIRGTLQTYNYDPDSVMLSAVGRESNKANGEECMVDFSLRIIGDRFFSDWKLSSVSGYQCSAAGEVLKDVELFGISHISDNDGVGSSASSAENSTGRARRGDYARTQYGRTTVYDGPGYGNNALFSLAEGTEVEVLEEAPSGSSIYFKIRHGGLTGWIDSISLDY